MFLGAFLVGSIDKLNFARGFHDLSYLSTCKRAMSNLNQGLSYLVLRLNPRTPDWLRKLTKGVLSMKEVLR